MIERYNYDDLEILVSDELTEEFKTITQIMSKDKSHSLHKNYSKINYTDYLFYVIMVYKGKVCGFHAAQQKEMYHGGIRAFTRLYIKDGVDGYNPHSVTHGSDPKSKFSAISYQIYNEKLKDQPVFVSRNIANPKNYIGFKGLVKYCRKISGIDLEYDNRLYQVAHNKKDKASWQLVFWFNDKRVPLKTMSLKTWSKLYA